MGEMGVIDFYGFYVVCLGVWVEDVVLGDSVIYYYIDYFIYD